jgi:hypothetical protein
LQAAWWAMDQFSTFLRGQKFNIYIDNKPLEKLGTVHTKTLYTHTWAPTILKSYTKRRLDASRLFKQSSN